jgi:hypothetical protein
MRGKEQAHDAQARFGSHGREHVGKARQIEIGLSLASFHTSSIVEALLFVKVILRAIS